MIGIVTVNWNGYQVTRTLLEDLLKNTFQDFIVIIVNNSPDETHLFNNNPIFQKDNVIILNSTHNSGYSGGLNKGIKYLEEYHKDVISYYLLMNNDLRMKTDFLHKTLKNFDNENAIISPLILRYDSNIVQNTGGKIVIPLGGTININKNIPKKNIKKIQPDFLSGCVLFMNKKVIENTGYFDEDYGSYYEDVDFCIRAKQLGYSLKIDYENEIMHYHSFSTKKNTDYKTYLINRNQILFARKNLSFFIKSIFVLAAIIRGIATGLLTKKLSASYKGIITGLFFCK